MQILHHWKRSLAGIALALGNLAVDFEKKYLRHIIATDIINYFLIIQRVNQRMT